MKTTDHALTNFAANYVSAQETAANDMIGYIMKFGSVNKEDATKAFNFYIKKKWLKFDYVFRKYTVKHGGMFDHSFITEVLEVA